MTPPKTFEKFREVQEELGRSGAAIFRDAEGVESLVVRSPYSIEYIHSYAEDSPFFLGLAEAEHETGLGENIRPKLLRHFQHAQRTVVERAGSD